MKEFNLSDFMSWQNELEASGRNVIVDKDGKEIDAKPAGGCAVSYVNCRTKKTEIVTLSPGQTFYYGDWNGTACVRKSFTC